ncbi:MAG: hypothetical protein JRI23_14880 [Deltaproteobacteria bacterium]|nr:hypothetical protein [Deltaproteobacteria bacterium]MBW2533034.1 hypothetical protein [Deltaproteobacteria bacterium]
MTEVGRWAIALCCGGIIVGACDGEEGEPSGTGVAGSGGRLCSAEICDGFDNDCDGTVDEECPCERGEQQPCYSGNPITVDVGECARGVQECTGEFWGGPCSGEVTPTDERCNSRDDDCNGHVDDACTGGGGTSQGGGGGTGTGTGVGGSSSGGPSIVDYADAFTVGYTPQGNVQENIQSIALLSGGRPTFGALYVDPENLGTYATVLDQIWNAHATPQINIQPTRSSAYIAAGSMDAAIRSMADVTKTWLDQGGGRTIVLAPLQEGNGSWVAYGADPSTYRWAFQRFVTIFRDERGLGYDKVRFAFAPNSEPQDWTSYYPGAGVDIIGFSHYNFDGASSPSFDLGSSLAYLQSFAPNLPVMVFQTATGDQSPYLGVLDSARTSWVSSLFSWAQAEHEIISFVYFDLDNRPGGPDFRIWDQASDDVNSGWIAGMQMSGNHYEFPLASWFRGGDLRISGAPAPLCSGDCDTIAAISSGRRWMAFHDAAHHSAAHTFYYGNPGDHAILGDWNCDGVKTPAVYRNSTTALHFSDDFAGTAASGSPIVVGNPGDLPIAGDWNGDGCDGYGLYRPSEGRFFLSNDMNTTIEHDGFYFGPLAATPMAGDFDGNGTDQVAVYVDATLYVASGSPSGATNPGLLTSFEYGNPGDRYFMGDWTGDGTDTVGSYRPSDGTIYLRDSNSAGLADYDFFIGTFELVVSGRE